MATARDVQRALRMKANREVAADFALFFKAGTGQYGEGDQFLGLRVPEVRAVAKGFADLSVSEITNLVESRYHEDRFCGLAILTNQFRKSRDVQQRESLWKCYVKLLDDGGINNWDLVDSTAPYFGAYLLTTPDPQSMINELILNQNLWHQRVGVMVTWPFIKQGQLEPTFRVCEKLLNHPHDLIHKACGWMLREAGKRDMDKLRAFLQINSKIMPRTMLRYAIEKMSPEERSRWLKS